MGKYLARGPYAMTESQIFSHPARPNLVNEHFIIWPIWRQIFFKFKHARSHALVVPIVLGTFTYSRASKTCRSVILLSQLEPDAYHWSTKMRAFIRGEYLSLIKVQEAEQNYNRPENLLSCNVTPSSADLEHSAQLLPSLFYFTFVELTLIREMSNSLPSKQNISFVDTTKARARKVIRIIFSWQLFNRLGNRKNSDLIYDRL